HGHINWLWKPAHTARSSSCRKMAKKRIKIGLIQTKVGDNVDENLARTAAFIKKAARKGAEIVCLQELFAHRYFAQVKDDRFFELAEPVPGPLSRFLAD